MGVPKWDSEMEFGKVVFEYTAEENVKYPNEKSQYPGIVT